MPRQLDTLLRALTLDGAVRAVAVNATRLCDRARRIQQSWPTATAALGRVLSGAALLAATIKEGERISLRIEADGPVEGIFAQATPDGRVRGYIRNLEVNPPSKGGKLDVGGAVGQGTLYVIRDLGQQEPYVGSVPLQNGEIGDDLAYYFTVSEQQPSAVGLGVLVETNNAVAAAGGYLVQPMPGAPEEVLARLEENIRGAPRPSELILSLRDPEQVLGVLLAGLPWQVLARSTPRYYCGCTRAKSRKALHALSTDDLREMLAAEEPTVVSCDFCGRRYEFPTEELARLLAEKTA